MSYNKKDTMNTITSPPVANTMASSTDTTSNANVNATPIAHNEANPQQAPGSLRQSVEKSLTQYFDELDGQTTTALYELFMHQVEAPLFECVMQHTQDNQSKAAALLGLNRGTLRKKLKQYDLL